MTDALTPVSKAAQALQLATTPEQSKDVEAMAAAARAWAKEQNDYELVIQATRIYIEARRRTTELSLSFAPEHGGDRRSEEFQDNNTVTLNFGFTPMQWSRRTRELEIPAEKIDEYFDECIEKHAIPTTWGLVRAASPGAVREERRCPNCGWVL